MNLPDLTPPPTPGVDILLAAIESLNGIWLAQNACLMHSHLPLAEGEPFLIRVVGVGDFGNWSGPVLMLD